MRIFVLFSTSHENIFRLFCSECYVYRFSFHWSIIFMLNTELYSFKVRSLLGVQSRPCPVTGVSPWHAGRSCCRATSLRARATMNSTQQKQLAFSLLDFQTRFTVYFCSTCLAANKYYLCTLNIYISFFFKKIFLNS